MRESSAQDRRNSGIVASRAPRGWLAKRWLGAVESAGPDHAARLARGKNVARSGRVRHLWFSPGLAMAEVEDDHIWRVSLRLRVYEEAEWALLVDTLAADLTLVAGLMAGELPRELVKRLEAVGLQLLPHGKDLDGDCDCPDFLVPCVHMAAVHQLVADALDGDPFLLFTLRGSERETLLARLRRRWGDTTETTSRGTFREEAPPSGDWLHSSESLGTLRLHVAPPRQGAPVGLLALGPAPDDADLTHALTPLYAAGSDAACELLFAEDAPRANAAARALPTQTNPEPTVTDAPAPSPDDKPPTDSAEKSLTERLVDALAAVECAKSKDLARDLGESMATIRTELLELEEMGVVVRTGRTRGTRWWLG